MPDQMTNESRRINDTRDSASRAKSGFQRSGKKPGKLSMMPVSIKRMAEKNNMTVPDMVETIRSNPDQFSKTERAMVIAYDQWKKQSE